RRRRQLAPRLAAWGARRARGRDRRPRTRGRSYGGTLGRDALAGSRTRTVEGCADEAAEERCRPGRPRLELRMELASDEPGMIGKLDDLDKPALLERAAHDKPRLDEPVPVRVVDL